MADTTMNSNQDQKPNQTMRHEQAKSQFSGERKPEQSNMDRERQEKSAIGGSSDQNRPAGEFDKSRSEFDKSRSGSSDQR